MKLTKELLANAFAMTGGVWWVACSLFTWFVPGFSMTVATWWFHNLKVEQLGTVSLDMTTFLTGGVSFVIAAWFSGYVFGWSLEYFSHKK